MGNLWKKITEHPLITTFIGILIFIFTAWPSISRETIPEFLTRKGWPLTMPSWYLVLVIGIGGIVAALQVVLIRTVRKSTQITTATNEQKSFAAPSTPSRRTQREAIAKFASDGDKLLELCKTATDAQDITEPHWEWMEKINTFLHNSLDESYVLRFRDMPNVTIYSGVASKIPERNRQAYLLIYSQIVQLHKFIEELRD